MLTNQHGFEMILRAPLDVKCFFSHKARDIYAASKLIRTSDGRAPLQQDRHGVACQEEQLIASPDIA